MVAENSSSTETRFPDVPISEKSMSSNARGRVFQHPCGSKFIILQRYSLDFPADPLAQEKEGITVAVAHLTSFVTR